MARYKHIDTSPRFLAVDLHKQLLPGSFEYTLSYLLDHEQVLPKEMQSMRSSQLWQLSFESWHPVFALEQYQVSRVIGEEQGELLVS